MQVLELITMEKVRVVSNWPAVIKHVLRIASILHNAQRGRIISLVKSHALLRNACIDKLEHKVCKRMRKELELDYKTLLPKITEQWPVVEGLFNTTLCYHKNAELRKVVNMCIIAQPLVGDELRMDFTHFLGYVQPAVPVHDWLTLWGISKDLHVLGLSEKSLGVFLDVGMRTDSTCDFHIGGLAIDVLEKNYIVQKKAAMLVIMEERKASKEKKRPVHNDSDGSDEGNEGDSDVQCDLPATVKRQKVVHDEVKTMVMQRANEAMKTFKKNLPSHVDFITKSNTVPKDSHIVKLIGNIRGFKHSTGDGVLKVQIGEFLEGSHVFVKIGETREINDKSCIMYEHMCKLGMTSVKACVVAVTWDKDMWQQHSIAKVTDKTKKWGSSMLQKMQAKVDKYAKLNLHMSMQVCEFFKGHRLGWVTELRAKMVVNICKDATTLHTFGKTLFEAIFFAVYAGIMDAGPFNMMLNSRAEVLLVDVNPGDETIMLVYNTKGLFRSSRKFDVKHIGAVISYVNTHFTEAADFLARLKESGCKNPYLLLDCMCPFFNDDNVELLRSGQKTSPYFKFLIASIEFNPAKKEASPPSFRG